MPFYSISVRVTIFGRFYPEKFQIGHFKMSIFKIFKKVFSWPFFLPSRILTERKDFVILSNFYVDSKFVNKKVKNYKYKYKLLHRIINIKCVEY